MRNADMPAMPFTHKPEYQHQDSGLTKREHFAAMAMQAMLSSEYVNDFNGDDSSFNKMLCMKAVRYSDALLEELEKTK